MIKYICYNEAVNVSWSVNVNKSAAKQECVSTNVTHGLAAHPLVVQ